MTTGVILAAFGYITDLDQVPGYLERIMGREPPQRAVDALRARFEAIGGPGPLAENTHAQRDALAKALGDGYDVRLGMRNAAPFLPHVAEGLAASGVDRIVTVALAPQFSAMSVGRYHDGVRQGLQRVDDAPPASFVRSYATHPSLVAYWTEAVTQALHRLPEAARGDARVLFTAHGLPRRILDEGDPYPDECQATADAVAKRLDLPPERYGLAYQSGHEGWLEPDVLHALDALAAEGAEAVVLAPIGFVAEHLETLDDLDIEARERAEALGLATTRALAPDADPRLIEALAESVREHAT